MDKDKTNVDNPSYLQLQEVVAQLWKDVENLKKNRIHQSDIPAGTIKQNHIGEGVIFIRSGLDADLPTAANAETTKLGQPLYWATDTNKLYIFNGATWKSVTLS